MAKDWQFTGVAGGQITHLMDPKNIRKTYCGKWASSNNMPRTNRLCAQCERLDRTAA
jgi:hypothetical protein